MQASSPGRSRDNQQMPEPKERHVSVKKISAVDAGIGHFPKQESAGEPQSTIHPNDHGNDHLEA